MPKVPRQSPVETNPTLKVVEELRRAGMHRTPKARLVPQAARTHMLKVHKQSLAQMIHMLRAIDAKQQQALLRTLKVS
jgi:hypothetical protein